MSTVNVVTNRTIEPTTSILSAAHEARSRSADIIDQIREAYHQIERESSHEFLFLSYERLSHQNKLKSGLALLGLIGALMGIGASAHAPQSAQFNQYTAIGKFLETAGTSSRSFVEIDQPGIEQAIKRLEELKNQAQQDDHEVDRILQRLDEMLARFIKQLSDAEIQVMRNS